jgi:hypothetical protein
VQGHGLRATFASIAEELVSGAVLKKMMNHAAGADVTLGHYVGKSEAQLRAGWQVVADFIEAAATPRGVEAEPRSIGRETVRRRAWTRAGTRRRARPAADAPASPPRCLLLRGETQAARAPALS